MSGAVLTKAGTPFPERLNKVYDDISLIIKEYKQDSIQ